MKYINCSGNFKEKKTQGDIVLSVIVSRDMFKSLVVFETSTSKHGSMGTFKHADGCHEI